MSTSGLSLMTVRSLRRSLTIDVLHNEILRRQKRRKLIGPATGFIRTEAGAMDVLSLQKDPLSSACIGDGRAKSMSPVYKTET